MVISSTLLRMRSRGGHYGMYGLTNSFRHFYMVRILPCFPDSKPI